MELAPVSTGGGGADDDFGVHIQPAARRLANIQTATVEARPIDRDVAVVSELQALVTREPPLRVLRAISALLARVRRPLVLTFDQCESLTDTARRNLTRLVTRLHAFDGVLVVVGFLATQWNRVERNRLIETERFPTRKTLRSLRHHFEIERRRKGRHADQILRIRLRA